MVGILGEVGRIAGREIVEEALGRIVAGRTTEDLYLLEKRLLEGLVRQDLTV